MLKQIKGRKVEIPDDKFYEGPDPIQPVPPYPYDIEAMNAKNAALFAMESAARGIPPLPTPKSREELLSAALDVLSFRLIMLVAVCISGALFALVAIWPSWIRLAGAAVFAMIVAYPIVYYYSRED